MFVVGKAALTAATVTQVFGPIPDGYEGSVTINVSTTNTTEVLVRVYISNKTTPTLEDLFEGATPIVPGSPLVRTGEPLVSGESVFVVAFGDNTAARVSGPVNKIRAEV